MNENMVKNETTEQIDGNNEPKLFTQSQVNEIVRKRLERQKEDTQAFEDKIKSLETREKDISKRESRLNCKEYLNDHNYPEEMLDIFDTSDVEDFKSRVDRAYNLFGVGESNVAPLASTEPGMHNISAFPEDTKHTPKGYWATDPH